MAGKDNNIEIMIWVLGGITLVLCLGAIAGVVFKLF
jgi:O-antigen ligase